MEERGPWWRVLIAVSVVAVIGTIAVAAFMLGQFAVVFQLMKTYFEAQGLSAEDAGNIAAGTLQSLVDVVFLAGILALFGFVDRGFKKHAQRRQAAREVLNAYDAFVSALRAVRQAEGDRERIKYGSFFASRIAWLRRAMDELSTRPFYFADVLPPNANAAIDQARRELDYFYAFTDNVTAWAAHPGADSKKDFFIGSRDQDKAMAIVTSLHARMEAFFFNAHPTAAIRKRLKDDLAKSMNELAGVAARFVTIERPKDATAPA